ncbi:MAG: hypothetical protein NTX61_02440 [Bacteroidetes bacterium]|nr:hypothetical protein [Bacteroidota bacterium]
MRYLTGTAIILLVLILSFTGCKKNNTSPPSQEALLTVNFTDQFIPDQLSAIIFISDADGNILADTTCSKNGTYSIYSEVNRNIPSRITVTIVNYEIIMHFLEVHLNTYTQVKPHSEWTLKGIKPDSAGHATVSLTHLPALTGPILFSNSGYNNLTFRFLNCTEMLYQSPDDIYIKIQTAQGDKYKWVSGITKGGNYEIDMSDAIPPDHHTITFPMSALDYEVSVAGYRGGDFDTPLTLRTDRILSDGNSMNAVDVAFPPSLFSGFITEVMLHENYQSDVQWFYHSLGDIPDQFRKIDAGITSVEITGNRVRRNTTGTYRSWNANWQFLSANQENFDWNIFGPDSTQTLLLPQIAPAVVRLFNSLSLDSLHYQYIQLDDFPNLNSYDEILQKMFVSSASKVAADFEMSSVRKNSGAY